MARIGVLACVILLASIPPTVAQQPAAVPSNSVVPQMVRFSGTLADMTGKSLTGIVSVTFYLYKDSQGGAPLWIETQNVQPDKAGHYSVMLGSTSRGLPSDLFASGEARWLGVQAQGQAEQPRVMLLAVPYALKAADAETLGGKPLSAFQLTTPQSNNSSTQKAQSPAEQLNEIACAGSTACKASFIPRFFTNGGSATVNNSVMSQSGTNIHIAGSESVSGNISSGANVSGQNGNFTNVNASWAGVGNGSLAQAIYAQSTAANGTGVQGVALGTGNTAGVLGHSSGQKSGSAGVLGVDDNVTIVGNSYTTGMTGQTFSQQGIGVLGLNGNRSSEFNLRVATHTAGVWGDGNDIGIVATSDLNGLWAVNNHPNAASIVAQNDTSASNGLILYATAPNVNSNGGSALCTINTHADLGCTGDIAQSRPGERFGEGSGVF